jgi:hypothetical protein
MTVLALWQSLRSDWLFERHQLLVPVGAPGTLLEVRLERLIDRHGRVLGVPAVRAASGDNLSQT